MKKFHRQVLLLFIGIFLAFNIIIKLFCYRKLVWKWAGLVNKTLVFASILISAEQYTQEYFPHMFLSTCYCIFLFKQFQYIPRALAFPVDLRWSHEQAALHNSSPKSRRNMQGKEGEFIPHIFISSPSVCSGYCAPIAPPLLREPTYSLH